MFAVKNYRQGVQRLLAACDEELLDQDYREGRLHLQVPSSFYDGMRVEQGDLEAFMRMCTVANLVGPRTVGVAVGLGLVEPQNVLEVAGMPHAQFMVL